MTRVLLNMPSQYAGKPSGVARMALCLIEALLQHREFDYVLRSPWDRSELPPSLMAGGLEVLKIKRPPIMVFDVILQTIVMQHLCRRLEIDLLVNFDPFGAPAGAQARVMVVHDLYFRTLPEQVGRREALTTDIIYRLMIANHDEIITVSDATKRDLARFYPSSAGCISTIHSAATLPPVVQGAQRPDVPGRYVLAVGNATLNKNFKVLAQAMAMLHESFPDLALVHVGSDPEETIAGILSSLGSAVRLVRLEGIDDAALASLYRGALCLCVPSLYEGFCLPVLEAQGMGCPVVCSDRSATPEIAGDAALTFDPEDPRMLAGTLGRILSTPGLSEQLVQSGLENLQRFSWDKAARQYEDVFRRALLKRGQAKRKTAAPSDMKGAR